MSFSKQRHHLGCFLPMFQWPTFCWGQDESRLHNITDVYFPGWCWLKIMPPYWNKAARGCWCITTRDVGSMPGLNQTRISFLSCQVFFKLSFVGGTVQGSVQSKLGIGVLHPLGLIIKCCTCSYMQSVVNYLVLGIEKVGQRHCECSWWFHHPTLPTTRFACLCPQWCLRRTVEVEFWFAMIKANMQKMNNPFK